MDNYTQKILFDIVQISRTEPEVMRRVSSSELRKAVFYLFMSELKYLTLEQLVLIENSLFGDTGISDSSLRSFIHREIKAGYVGNGGAISYNNRPRHYYVLKSTALPLLKKYADKVLAPAGREVVDMLTLKTEYTKRKTRAVNRHSIEAATAWIKIFFLPHTISRPVPLILERPFTLNRRGAKYAKLKGDLTADLSIEHSANHYTCIEVDMNTERRQELFGKIVAYCNIQYRGNLSYNLSPMDLVFLLINPSLEERRKKSLPFSPSIDSCVNGRQSAFYAFMLETFSENENGHQTLEELINELILLKKKGIYRNGNTVCQNLIELLTFISEHFSEDGIFDWESKKKNGKMEVRLLPLCLEELQELKCNQSDDMSQYAIRKRAGLYKDICEKGDETGITQTLYLENTGSLLRGMVVSFVESERLSDYMLYLFPSQSLQEHLEDFCFNVFNTPSPNCGVNAAEIGQTSSLSDKPDVVRLDSRTGSPNKKNDSPNWNASYSDEKNDSPNWNTGSPNEKGNVPVTVLNFFKEKPFEQPGCFNFTNRVDKQNVSSGMLSSFLSLPLRGYVKSNGFGIYTENYSTFMRNCFTFNGLQVCIENISHDIGGMLRTIEYMKIPSGLRPGTLLVCLVSDDLILADGTSIFSNHLFEEWRKGTKHKEIFFRGTAERIYAGQLHEQLLSDYRRINNLPGPFYQYPDELYLPFLYDQTQDYCVLTYSEFKRAFTESVCPWIPVAGSFKVKRGVLPDGHFLPNVPISILDENDCPALYPHADF